MPQIFTTYRPRIAFIVASHDREAARFAHHAHFAKTADGVWVVWRDAMPGRAAVVFADQLRDEAPCSWLVAGDPHHPIERTLSFADEGGLHGLRASPDRGDARLGYRLYPDAFSLRVGVLAGGDPALETWILDRVQRAKARRAAQVRTLAMPPRRGRQQARCAFQPDPEELPIVPSLSDVLGLSADDWLERAPRLALT